MLGELMSRQACTSKDLPGEQTLADQAAEFLIEQISHTHNEHDEHPLTRENYLRIAREITDSTSEEYNPTYRFNTCIKQERLQYGPQKHTDEHATEADTFIRTEDASTHVNLMRHTITTGNEGSIAHQIRTRKRREMTEVLDINPPPYHEGNKEYIHRKHPNIHPQGHE